MVKEDARNLKWPMQGCHPSRLEMVETMSFAYPEQGGWRKVDVEFHDLDAKQGQNHDQRG
jgi:hypothetical protein